MTKKEQQYYEGVGRRKTSIARVRLSESGKLSGEGAKEQEIIVNDKNFKDYFSLPELCQVVTAPLRATATEKSLKVMVKVKGGGIHGQADAVQLGIARALVKLSGDYQKNLRDLDYLKRDPRKKERKKPGLKKARRGPQWAKR